MRTKFTCARTHARWQHARRAARLRPSGSRPAGVWRACDSMGVQGLWRSSSKSWGSWMCLGSPPRRARGLWTQPSVLARKMSWISPKMPILVRPRSLARSRVNTSTPEEGEDAYTAMQVHTHEMRVCSACPTCTMVRADAPGNAPGEGQDEADKGCWRVTCEPDELAAVGNALGIAPAVREQGVGKARYWGGAKRRMAPPHVSCASCVQARQDSQRIQQSSSWFPWPATRCLKTRLRRCGWADCVAWCRAVVSSRWCSASVPSCLCHFWDIRACRARVSACAGLTVCGARGGRRCSSSWRRSRRRRTLMLSFTMPLRDGRREEGRDVYEMTPRGESTPRQFSWSLSRCNFGGFEA